jgi:hypothetical protein
VNKRVREWKGGYVAEGKRGRVFIIEKMINGRRFHVSTRCTDEGAANKQLERFEANPGAYRPEGDAVALRITAQLIEEYRAYQRGRGQSDEWTTMVSRLLAQWITDLRGTDLRHLDPVRDLKAAVERHQGQRAHRIKAIKGFCRWLRTEKGLMRHAEDPTLDLKVPQPTPAKYRRRKVVEPERVGAVLKKLPRLTRDMLHLLTATAWHVSELRRFMTAGEVLAHKGGVVLVTRHKGGKETRTPLIHPEHIAVARRLCGMGNPPTRVTTARHMRAACKAADVDSFGLGVMRHSVLTWGVQRGATTAAAADFAGHESERTTKRFYLDQLVPTASIPLVRFLRGGRSDRSEAKAASASSRGRRR